LLIFRLRSYTRRFGTEIPQKGMLHMKRGFIVLSIIAVMCFASSYALAAASSGAQSCSAGQLRAADRCDSAGACTSGAVTGCKGYQCNQAGTECLTGCSQDPDCTGGYYCKQGRCAAMELEGRGCGSDRQCASGNCVDGVCCDQKCAGNCRYCKLPGSVGKCKDVPNGQDPRVSCQASQGGHPVCAGTCMLGQCTYPDVGTMCALCAACDGTGRCVLTPSDDNNCGVVSCQGLSTTCRTYRDLTANRCAGLGQCKAANDPATCTAFTDLPCPCTSNTQCASGSCTGGKCTCDRDAQCAFGRCRQGLCDQ
jgi:hypothetical protein